MSDTENTTLNADEGGHGMLWIDEGMAHRASLVGYGETAVLSIERIRDAGLYQTAYLDEASRVELAYALLLGVNTDSGDVATARAALLRVLTKEL